MPGSRKRVGNGNGYQSDSQNARELTTAMRLLMTQRDRGAIPQLPPILLTPDGLRKIVSLITRSSELDSRDLGLLKAWVDAYHHAHP